MQARCSNFVSVHMSDRPVSFGMQGFGNLPEQPGSEPLLDEYCTDWCTKEVFGAISYVTS